MKSISLILAAVAGIGIFSPSAASANPYDRSQCRVAYDSCGRAVYSVLTYVGRDCEGCPVYRWVVQPRRDCDRPVYRGDRYRGHGGYRSNARHDSHHGDRCGRGGFSIRIGR